MARQLDDGTLVLDDYKVLVITTHPEYWTRKMFFAVREWVQERGVSRHDIAGIWVAFFSGCQRYRCGQGKACNSSVMDSHQQPGSLFNGMILPLANLTIRSAIWYQGERLPLSA